MILKSFNCFEILDVTDETLKIVSNEKNVVEIIKRPFVPIKITSPNPKQHETIVKLTNVSKDKRK